MGEISMIHRIEIGFQEGVQDAQGEKIRERIREHLGFAVSRVERIDVYTLDGDVSEPEAQEAARELFSDSITQCFALNQPLARDFDWLVEIGFLPGVTDNVGRTARETLETYLDRPLGSGAAIYTSRQYLLTGELSKEQTEQIATGLLANTLVQRYEIRSRAQWTAGDIIRPSVPKVTQHSEMRVEEIDLEITDQALVELSQDKVLVLSLEEMKIIQEHLRDPKVLEARAHVGLNSRITDV
jgi:phosphoribosylformylglycinamidine (FGAM) synthase PurS component